MPQGVGYGNLLSRPGFNLGVGLLAGGGPSPVPTSFGQNLAGALQFSSDRERQELENRLIRQQMLQAQRQREMQQRRQQTLSRLPGLLAGGDQRAEQALGLLGELSPEALTQAFVGQMFPQPKRETALLQNMRAAGIDPRSEEGRELIVQEITGGDIQDTLARLQASQAELEIERRREQIEQARTEREKAQRSDRQERIGLQNAIATDIERGLEAAALLDAMEGTAVQTGVGSEWRETAVGFAGLAFPELERLAGMSNRFGQLATGFGVDALTRMKELGTISDRKFQALIDNLMSMNAQPTTNRAGLADIFESVLDSADQLELFVPKRGQVEALIPKLRSASSSPSDGFGSGVAPRFSSMEQAQAALDSGRLQVGQEVIVNGQRMKVAP